jgi:hypothetical protein
MTQQTLVTPAVDLDVLRRAIQSYYSGTLDLSQGCVIVTILIGVWSPFLLRARSPSPPTPLRQMRSMLQTAPLRCLRPSKPRGAWASPARASTPSSSKVSSTTVVDKRCASLPRALSAVSPQTRPLASPSSRSAPGPFWRSPAAMPPSAPTSLHVCRSRSSHGPGSDSRSAA